MRIAPELQMQLSRTCMAMLGSCKTIVLNLYENCTEKAAMLIVLR